jgi:hypothetical protein
MTLTTDDCLKDCLGFIATVLNLNVQAIQAYKGRDGFGRVVENEERGDPIWWYIQMNARNTDGTIGTLLFSKFPGRYPGHLGHKHMDTQPSMEFEVKFNLLGKYNKELDANNDPL